MIVINLLGVVLIALIVWWFWLYKPEADVQADGPAVIGVNNGVYEPARIQVPAGQNIELRFLRRDASPCAAMVQFPDFQISEELPLDQEKSIQLPPMQPGAYPFHCQMQMYRGTVVVV